jgi:hypothetical protein
MPYLVAQRNPVTSQKWDPLMRRLVLFVAVVCAALTPAIAAQARPAAAPTGYDISFPQCGKSYPSGQAFAIVGVNGGKASNFNPCFADEWAWAKTSGGGTPPPAQPPAQLYVYTGNPGDVLAQYNVTDWPTSGDTPYGTCSGTWTDDKPCSWQYGYERATADIGFVREKVQPDPSSGKWWLDIETANSWTSDKAKNQASLEGMVYALQHVGATVGIYSTNGAWSSLFGTVAGPPNASPLYSLNEWRPGARTLAQAQSNCSLAPFEGDPNNIIEITQYVSAHLDHDYSCI